MFICVSTFARIDRVAALRACGPAHALDRQPIRQKVSTDQRARPPHAASAPHHTHIPPPRPGRHDDAFSHKHSQFKVDLQRGQHPLAAGALTFLGCLSAPGRERRHHPTARTRTHTHTTASTRDDEPPTFFPHKIDHGSTRKTPTAFQASGRWMADRCLRGPPRHAFASHSHTHARARTHARRTRSTDKRADLSPRAPSPCARRGSGIRAKRPKILASVRPPHDSGPFPSRRDACQGVPPNPPHRAT